MIEISPDYYDSFCCIADRCKHSCCIGWEIDIDDETMALYRALNTDLGERIRQNIEGEVPHFILREGERCPFLTNQGLCEIISHLGEDGLCDICALHPRFRNFYSAFYETGLGLCCEEAARIILTKQEKVTHTLPRDVALSDEEAVFFSRRRKVFALLQDRSLNIRERFSRLAEQFGFSFSFSLEALCARYMALERLDEAWTEILNKLKGFSFSEAVFGEDEMQIPFEQLAVYFVFRHLSGAICDGNYAGRVHFALMSCYFIGALWAQDKEKNGTIEAEQLVDFARMYSAEVEYSEENLASMIQMI